MIKNQGTSCLSMTYPGSVLSLWHGRYLSIYLTDLVFRLIKKGPRKWTNFVFKYLKRQTGYNYYYDSGIAYGKVCRPTPKVIIDFATLIRSLQTLFSIIVNCTQGRRILNETRTAATWTSSKVVTSVVVCSKRVPYKYISLPREAK